MQEALSIVTMTALLLGEDDLVQQRVELRRDLLGGHDLVQAASLHADDRCRRRPERRARLLQRRHDGEKKARENLNRGNRWREILNCPPELHLINDPEMPLVFRLAQMK